MKRLFLPILCCLSLVPGVLHAQFDEFGIIFGVANYSGDLTERAVEPLESNMAHGIYVRKELSHQLGLKVQLSRIVLSGKDVNNSVQSGLWRRNLSFNTQLYEVGAQMEWIPISLKSGDNQFVPYFFAGVALFHFSPQAEMDGQTYDLRHYRTEGVSYGQFQIALPFGTGLRLNVMDRGSLGFELGLRKTFTDYLDDVSTSYRTDLQELAEKNSLVARLSDRSANGDGTGNSVYAAPGSGRGNPKKKDWYMLFGLTLGINISN